VSFTVEKGDIFGFIGPNGAGKTTTIRTLLALIKPTSGHAEIFGMDCMKNARAIASRVGYLPAETYYYDRMRFKELLQYAADLYRAHAKDRIEELSERLKLDLNRKIVDLSTGNKKKVAIVAALLHGPELLIMDEPTSGLDPLIQQIFFEILKEENSNGSTILFSSHVLGDVQKISNKVAILKNGTVINIHNTSEFRETGYKKITLSAYNDVPNN
jgi:ABC-2 type transport system ATP-binding protein